MIQQKMRMNNKKQPTPPIQDVKDKVKEPKKNDRRWLLLSMLWDDKVALLSALVLITMMVGAVGAEILSPYNPHTQDLYSRILPPSLSSPASGGFPHLLGTDELGRDLLGRLMLGARVSLAVGALAVVLSGSIGVLLGLIAGYFRGWTDSLIMRLVDIQMGFPSLLTALLFLYVLGPGFDKVIIVLGISAWMQYARLTRGQMLSLTSEPFVEAARVIGARDGRIIFRHILPNLASPVLILATLEFGNAVLVEAGLSFLGLGVQPPQTSWGLILARGRQYIGTAWWLTVFPGLFIFITVLSLNLLVTFLRSATDPACKAKYIGRKQQQRQKGNAIRLAKQCELLRTDRSD